ncbi:CBS domain-containing protein [Thiohalocapsa sp. ML1]|uniref:CBS domain-containing protein n=1 Tax=Thiohalocapsa sp. ML1 TaxID=1431688 RepID=UPI0007323580|nr:CBS domain-containing protein [Thiohalocapsa sp. ML1]
MQVSQQMSRDVRVATPDQSIKEVARLMADIDAGFMPVGDNDKLVGSITDRDIAVRAVAAGKGPDTLVKDVMTQDVKYCFEDEDLGQVAQSMSDQRVRRMPVLDRNKRLVGVVSLGDIAAAEPGLAGETAEAVAQPGGPHHT